MHSERPDFFAKQEMPQGKSLQSTRKALLGGAGARNFCFVVRVVAVCHGSFVCLECVVDLFI